MHDIDNPSEAMESGEEMSHAVGRVGWLYALASAKTHG